MIVIISGTNRPGSNTRKVTARVEAGYKALGVKTQVLDLAEMPPEIFAPTSYAEKPAGFKRFTDAILAADGLVIVTPEYNGGVPGDAIIPVTDSVMTGPTSTFIGASLLNWLMVSTMEWLRDHGHDLPVLRSQNVPGSIERNRAVGAKYKHRLSKQLA